MVKISSKKGYSKITKKIEVQKKGGIKLVPKRVRTKIAINRVDRNKIVPGKVALK